MKAINCLEWILKQVGSYGDIPDIHLHGNYLEVLNLYSQPFKPEMITEYFEGWAVSLVSSPLRAVNDPKVWNCYSDIEKGVSYWWLLIKDETQLGFPNGTIEFFKTYLTQTKVLSRCAKCVTLNHFISDCNRAGIELTWKPEIEKRFQ